MCSIVNLSSHAMRFTGPSVKKSEYNTRIINVHLTCHRIHVFCLSKDIHYNPLNVKISCAVYSLGTHPTLTATALTLFKKQSFMPEKRTISSEMSPLRASLAAEFPLTSTWLGTQIKTISFPSLVSFMYSSKIGTKIGWSYFRLNIACNDKRVRHYFF